jgi:hypothetical protein
VEQRSSDSIIVELVAAGLTNAQIAKQLGSTRYMVANYLQEIFDATGTWSRLQLALRWQEQNPTKVPREVIEVAKSSTSPQSRSHAWLKERGWQFGKTEQSITIPDPASPTGRRMFKRDLFGFADIVGVHPDVPGTTYFQVTAGMGSHKADRLKKIEDSPAIVTILKAGNTVEFQAWRKLGPRGGVKRWEVYRCQARLERGKIVWKEVSEDQNDDEDFAPQPSLGFARVPA